MVKITIKPTISIVSVPTALRSVPTNKKFSSLPSVRQLRVASRRLTQGLVREVWTRRHTKIISLLNQYQTAQRN